MGMDWAARTSKGDIDSSSPGTRFGASATPP
jgi:hypothetical protein